MTAHSGIAARVEEREAYTSCKPGMFLGPKIPGYNVDKIDVEAGLQALQDCGYDEPFTVEVVAYALQRWARGEEAAAERGAIDRSFHGIDLTSWYRVIAAAQAAA